MKKSVFTYILVLVLTALVLFGLTFGLRNTAEANKQSVQLRMMQALLPGSESFVVVPYDGSDVNIQSVHKADNGFVIETLSYGYAGNIRMYVGVSNEGKVTGLVVREAHETVGLGNNALTDHVFLAQFLNSAGSFEIATNGADAFSSATGTADAGSGETVEVDGITGATVTSKAVARSVNSAVGYVTGADVASSATTWGG